LAGIDGTGYFFWKNSIFAGAFFPIVFGLEAVLVILSSGIVKSSSRATVVLLGDVFLPNSFLGEYLPGPGCQFLPLTATTSKIFGTPAFAANYCTF
jgi:hypothetical protein